MTLSNAQDLAYEMLKASFVGFYPKVYVEKYDGVLSFVEARRRYANTPLLLVSPLGIDGEKVQLAVFLLATSTDKEVMDVCDKVVETLRILSGDGRDTLDVVSKTLYDNEALKGGLRIWSHLAYWPHLADGEHAEEVDNPISKAKEKIKDLFPEGIKVATNEAEAKKLRFGSLLPFVTVLTGQGTFDKAHARTVTRIIDGKRYKQTVKGEAIWPLTVTCYATSESEADAVLWPILPYIQYTDSDEMQFNTTLKIDSLESGGVEDGASISSVKLMLSVPVIQGKELIPSVKDAMVLEKEEQ